jgi:hypothetical protein
MTSRRRSEPGLEAVLARLLDDQRRALHEDLVGSYLFGSAATGSFEPGISDVDTVAVLRSDLTDAQLAELDQLHRAIVQAMPEWDDRIESVYLSSRALRDFRTQTSPAARISPGEPFHAIEVDHRWLIDWYQLREAGIALAGPSAASLMPAISREEYLEAVRRHLVDWRDWAGFETPGRQAYAILTMCRGFRTIRTGEYVSKREAARWASEELPREAELIEQAVVWRERSRTEPLADRAMTQDAARRFLESVESLVR